MTTGTDLANAALAYLGEMAISNIDDTSSKQARTCKQFMQDTIDEVLRGHRWSCAIKLDILTLDATAPLWGYERQFHLPNDLLQLLEINGQQPGCSQQYYEIQGKMLLSNWEEAKIRYVRRIPIADFDPLLAKAIALSLAAKICLPLSLNLNLQNSCVQQAMLAIGEAKRINAIEKTTNANHQWGRLYGSSPLLRVRGRGYNDLLRYGYFHIPVGPY